MAAPVTRSQVIARPRRWAYRASFARERSSSSSSVIVSAMPATSPKSTSTPQPPASIHWRRPPISQPVQRERWYLPGTQRSELDRAQLCAEADRCLAACNLALQFTALMNVSCVRRSLFEMRQMLPLDYFIHANPPRRTRLSARFLARMKRKTKLQLAMCAGIERRAFLEGVDEQRGCNYLAHAARNAV